MSPTTAPVGPARLLDTPAADVVDFDTHLGRWGSLPRLAPDDLLGALEASGLRGHGGAWFPTGTKWRAVASQRGRGRVVVANGAEGEPASGKDRMLLHRTPHLVLDGAAMAASAIGADRVVVHVPAEHVAGIRRALGERDSQGTDRCRFEIVVAPDRFLAGQESAVVNAVNGHTPGIPSFTAIRPVRDRGVNGRPTLVQNVETLAHAALIARFGPDWFRAVGTVDSPGTTLVTVTGLWEVPRIVEVPLGMPLDRALGIIPTRAADVQAVLLGGYGGAWLSAATALGMPYAEESARAHGASIGAGVVVLLPESVCPITEVARVVRYLEGEGAGQCGPCVNGLADIATAVERLADRPRSWHGGASVLPTLCDLVEGRGACRHPDGVARFVRSALDVFAAHTDEHLRRGPCRTGPPFLPLPPATAAPR